MPSRSPVATRRRSPAARLAGGVLGAWLLASPPLAGQPAGVAGLTLEGRRVAAIPFTQEGTEPLFAIAPIAAALGVELRVGPLGDSHTLIFENEHVIFGSGQATLVTASPDGRRQDEITRVARPPVRDAGGLKVSLELLELALGERLNYRFRWDPAELALAVSRPELRRLRGSLNLVHQFGLTTVEVQLSARPRYRVERLPGALEIRLIGDRLELPLRVPEGQDPLVSRIAAAPDRLRLELAANADAAEPRLLLEPRVRLVVEVFERAASVQAAPPPRRGARRSDGIRTIALDPGHGGSETGAVGKDGTAEEDLTLLVARALRQGLLRRLPVKVILTRNGDVDVPLETRTAIANQHRADLFISLHFNSSFGRRAHGAETFFLSREASDQMAAELAAAENAAGASEEDPELDLQLILWDLAQTYHLAESQRFANLVQEELNLTLGLRDRGVKQAPFRVLTGAMMPAVLVELGFLSNPEEEAKLQSPIYRNELVDALVRAVVRFKAQIEGTDVAAQAAAPSGGAGAQDPR